MVNKTHYYFSVVAMGKIVDSHFADYLNRFDAERKIKAVWDMNFKLYVETDEILDKISDPLCPLFPLYRDLGSSEEDYVFLTREDAEKEYTEHIDRSIADRLYDL